MKNSKSKAIDKAKKSTGTATSTNAEVKSPTSTKTATSTEAYTQGNITVTGGAGKGNTIVHIGSPSEKGNKVDNKAASDKSRALSNKKK